MNNIFTIGAILLIILFWSCTITPENGSYNYSGNDTITGWENAGIISTGDSSHHVDVASYGGNLFTFNFKGELFSCTYPNLNWSPMTVPNGNKVYCIFCDSTDGTLYISTRNSCGVFGYEINTKQWKNLTPNKNNWYDSTKLLNGKLHPNMYNIIGHNNKLFIMTAQGWNDNTGRKHYLPTIWCSDKDTIWEKADSGWYNVNGYSDAITDFFSIDNILYASTFEHGVWRYDGTLWMVIPGTRYEDIQYIDTSGGDIKSIPGIHPRSMIKHNNEVYVGNLHGRIYKLLLGDLWKRVGLFYVDYNANSISDFGTPCMSLYSYKGYLIKGTYYYNDSANLWYNMTPYFNKIDPRYNNGLPGSVFGMTNIGDTIFAALGNNDGKHSGVYFLDLKTRKWYNNFH